MRKKIILTWFSFITATLICGLNIIASTKRVDDSWVLENDALRVTVQAESAQMSVIQKSTGVQWIQENPLDRYAAVESVKIWRADTPPTIDGDAKEWQVKDTIWLPWTGDDGEKNLSGGARLMWDDTHVYLYIRVRDNQRAFGKESTKEWWEADSVELWIDKVQVGLHLCPGKEVAVNHKGEVLKGSTIAVKLIDEAHLPGYAVEVAMPIEHFPVLKNPATGVRIYFAIGLNDADPKPGEPLKRVAQGYYPRTWVHSIPHTFSIAVLTDSVGKAPLISKANNRTYGGINGQATNMRKGSGSNTLAYALKLTHGQIKPVDLEVELKLLDDEPAMEVRLSCPESSDTPIQTILYPAPLYPPNPESYFMAMTDYCGGRYVSVGDKLFREKRLNSYGGDMPWVTVTDGRQGMMTIAMTPSDSCIQMQSRSKDKEKLGFPGFGWLSSKGTFGDTRVGRLVFYDKGAHVKACKIYRGIAKEEGLLRKLTVDARDNPDVLKLMGAVDWWGAPGLSFVQEAVEAGMKHGLLNGHPNPAEMEAIKKLGWLVGAYDNYEDINDSPTLGYTKAPVKEHALVQQDGELMTAWVTRDKDMNPTHTYMKQCTAMMLKHAQAVMPGVLEAYPYNTRFLDVTTSTTLKECYSPVHGVTRSQDLINRQNLLKYFSRDLRLVTGSEHGRYYGIPYLHYHEGMMGGGMYSWPAGYLRDVEDREDISEKYLNYGINPAHRAPLFELVFHDCVVNYWYWGACSDYLHQVMPELTDRKTAMNILYGTPPMMWSHTHGLRWDIPEERELMLTIYRNVCKLHEIIGPQEMVSHAFLSNDRMVQQSTFEDGTVATVNFSTSPFDVTTKFNKKTLTLLENDFYAHGPKIEQWRVTTDKGAMHQTYIRTDDYLFTESGSSTFEAAGVTSTGQINIIMESDNRAKIMLKAGSSLRLRVPEWRKKWKGKRMLTLLDKSGKPQQRMPNGDADTLELRAPADGSVSYLLYEGKEAETPDVTIEKLELSLNGKAISADAPLPQNAILRVAATIKNMGLTKAEDFTITIYLDSANNIELESQRIRSLTAGAACTVTCTLPAAKADGLRNITAVITAKHDVSLCGRTTVTTTFTGPCEPASFSIRKNYTLRLPDGEPAGMPVDVPFELKQTNNQSADPKNFRVLFQSGSVVPAQFEASEHGETSGRLIFCIPTGIPSGCTTTVQVLGVLKGTTPVYPYAEQYTATDNGTRIEAKTYSASIINGTLSSISIKTSDGGNLTVASKIIASSKETGWSSEEGTAESLICLQRGPVRTIYSCVKTLKDSHRLTRTWFFYSDRFEVHSTCTPHVTSLNRAFYLLEATASNGGDKTVKMDGFGDAEDFGFKGKPSWYAVYSDHYRNACIALSKGSGFTYWDSGNNFGQISLNHNGEGTEKRVYIWGPGTTDDNFAQATAQAYQQGIIVQ